jgi:glycosyltransferase involved in cell wall biosynthesis
MAMLFPIQWNEPFGLVMLEAMACGTPVLALPGGSVREIVSEGVSGHVCRSIRGLVNSLRTLNIKPATVRQYVEENFSIEKIVASYVSLYKDSIANKNEHRAA